MLAEANPRVHLGANNPPADPLEDPFTAHETHINDLYLEAANWCDGAAIENDAQAAEVDRLLADLKAAIDAAEQAQTNQIQPLTDKVTAIRERFYPLIGDTKKVTGKAIRAKRALLAVKTAWANKLEAARAEEAKRLRDEAAAAAALAAEAARAARGDLVATEQAEALIHDATAVQRDAVTAERAVKVSGMRDNWVAAMTDPVAAARWAWADHRTECEAFFLQLAQADVRAGKRTIAGFTVTNERRAV
jgi:hypothetical protein